jgi:hypothetical protein
MGPSILGAAEESLKQKGRKAFFSEEKKQKTFSFQQLATWRPWPGSCRRRGNKSLLVLFFRKEHLSCVPDQWSMAAPARRVATPQPPCYPLRAP